MTSRLRGVVIKPVPHGANALSMNTLFTNIPPVKNPLELLAQVCQLDSRKVTCNIIESSFEDLDEPKEEVYGCKNGFVDTVIKAYSNHHHLVLRPDDLWIAILTQVNIYVNIHAEEFRDMFVRHEGRKDLTVRFAERSDMEHTAIADAHWGKFAYKMTELLAEHIRDPSLREWILPQFSTTTKTDQAVASIAMMATMKKYVHSRGQLGCGLPSVTLLGRKNDWEKLVEKVERLPSFGQECTIWHSLLVPVLRRFVASYEAPEAEETKEFWQKIAHCSGSGSGSTYLSGWITAFCFWDVDGNLLLKAGENLQVQAEKDTGEEEMIAAGGTRKSRSGSLSKAIHTLHFSCSAPPSGYLSLPQN